MAINPLGAPAPQVISGAGSVQKAPFADVLKGQHSPPARLESAPTPVRGTSVTEAKSVQSTHLQKCQIDASARLAPQAGVTAARVLEQVSQAQSRMEQILKMAESGKSFSPAELLSLQTHVYRASQQLDLAGKVVEKTTGGVKQVLQTQV